jgi:outer membrane protein assembly factor BamA
MFTGNAYRYGIAGVMLCLSLLLGLAQERRVESVAVRGLRNISETAVITALRLKPGEPFSEATLESDRRANRGDGAIQRGAPRASSRPRRACASSSKSSRTRSSAKCASQANTVLSAEQLLEVVRNKPGFVFNTNFAESDIRAIRDAYQRAGYIVLPEGYTPPDYENGVLTIALSELRVGDIRVEGNTKTRHGVILREMRTNQATCSTRPASNATSVASTTRATSIKSCRRLVCRAGVIDLTLKSKSVRRAG